MEESPDPNLQFRGVGLQNLADKYLNVESFGNKVNASAAGLTMKQTFTLIFNRDETISLQGYTGKFVSSDRYGNITCGKEEMDSETKYLLNYSNDGTGRCSLKHSKHGLFVGGLDDNLHCIAKAGSEAEMSLWYIHLAGKSQGRLVNIDKIRYVKMNNNELRCNKESPWGPNSLITLEYINGKYAIKTSNNKYLSKDGSLVDGHGNDTKFSLEIKLTPKRDGRGMAFKDKDGHYLMPYGTYGMMKSKDKSTETNHYFLFEEIPTEVIIASSNGNNASVSQGGDVTVTTTEQTNKQIFQINYHEKFNKWTLKSENGNYWRLGSGPVIQVDGKEVADDTLFDIGWRQDGTASIKTSKKNYVAYNVTKALCANSQEVKDKEVFYIKMARPSLILKGEYGYVGMKTQSSKQEYGCNNYRGELLILEHGEKGSYHIKRENGKYWAVVDGNIVAMETNPCPFIIELVSDCKLTIKASNGKYLAGEKNGNLRASSDSVDNMSIWTF